MECLIRKCNFNYKLKCMKTNKIYKECKQKNNTTIGKLQSVMYPVKAD